MATNDKAEDKARTPVGEAEELRRSEEAGKRQSYGEDPAVKH